MKYFMKNDSIKELTLSGRTYNTLMRVGITTINQLLALSIDDLESIKNLGQKQLSIDNHTEVYPVYKIRLDKLYYNDQNDRIATWISQYKADNKINSIDMKNKEEYNNIMRHLILHVVGKRLSLIMLKSPNVKRYLKNYGRTLRRR